jgi:hypothetical protein
LQHVYDYPKINIFFFVLQTIFGNSYLDMLEKFAILKLEEDEVEIFQQDGASPQYSSIDCDAPTDRYSVCCMGRAAQSFGL